MTNNPLENIPEGYFTDTKLILWICTLQRDNDKHVNDLEIANSDLEDHMRQEEEENINLRTEVGLVGCVAQATPNPIDSS